MYFHLHNRLAKIGAASATSVDPTAESVQP